MDLDAENFSETEDLSDEQIEQLLKKAERRLANQVATKRNEHSLNLRRFPKLDTSSLPTPYVQTENKIARIDSARLIDNDQRKLAATARKIEDPVVSKQKHLEEKKATAGSSWYNLPRTDLTPQFKRDLQLLSMRSVLDPKRHYKKESGKIQAPQFSQVGTMIEGPTEFFSARLQNKDRKRTLVEEVMTTEQESGRFERKYGEIQGKKRSGKKGHYKEMISKRYGHKFKR